MKTGKNQESSLRVDASTSASLLNRYLALVRSSFFNTKGAVAENKTPIRETTTYRIQWENIRADLKGLFTNPFKFAPSIAYSLMAFFFIVQGKHSEAFLVAFGGAIAHDASSQSSASGEPASITWSHTVAGSDRLGVLFAGGLNNPNLGDWGGNAVTEIITAAPARSSYRIAPATGATTLTVDGGNIKVGAAISFTGAHQTTPIGATTSEIDVGSPNDMSLTTEANGSIRLDAMVASSNVSTNPTATLDTGTSRFSPITPQNQFRIGYFGYSDTITTAGSTTRTWTHSNANETRKYLAIEIKESTGGGGGSIPHKVYQKNQAIHRASYH